MNDYIKRENVLSGVEELKKSPWWTWEIGRLYREEAVDIVVKLCINSQRSYDAVEVTRCKDCKYSRHWYFDKYLCDLWDKDGGVDVFGNGFCNYGETE